MRSSTEKEISNINPNLDEIQEIRFPISFLTDEGGTIPITCTIITQP
jgi:hypothetical protein